MKKKILLNLVMGISLITTPALILTSCSAQTSDVKLPITVKDVPGIITVHEVNAKWITLATVQKLFNIVESDFNNVVATWKYIYSNVTFGQTNHVVLTAKNGFIFENGTKSLESIEFTLSRKTQLPITVKSDPGIITVPEATTTGKISLTTVQKLFNIEESDFKNVTASLVKRNDYNYIVLFPKYDYTFEYSDIYLSSGVFDIIPILPITLKRYPDRVNVEEVWANPISLITLQKIFDGVDASNFVNFTVSITRIIHSLNEAQIILTANEGFVFENGTNTLDSGWILIYRCLI